MATRTEYTEETKAAVMTALLTGQSLSSVAKAYEIPKSTVANWSAELGRMQGTVPNAKKERIGDLIIEYVSTALKTMQYQVEAAADETYLKKHSPSEFAVLHGVIADKAIRILEAIAPEQQSDDNNAEPDIP